MLFTILVMRFNEIIPVVSAKLGFAELRVIKISVVNLSVRFLESIRKNQTCFQFFVFIEN